MNIVKTVLYTNITVGPQRVASVISDIRHIRAG
jgi:hypothetical protein